MEFHAAVREIACCVAAMQPAHALSLCFCKFLSPIRAVLRRTAPKAATHFVAPVQ